MENRSNSVCKQLERMGAVVVKKFTNDEPVTHVIWKEGKKSTKDKAIKRGIHVVSILWVDSCKRNQQHAEESLFPVTDSSEDTAIVIPRTKRMKSMQPKTFEEDLESSTERMVRKRKKKETPQPSRLYLNSPVAVLKPLVYAAETQDPFTPVGTPVPGQDGTPSLIPDTPASMRACLDALSRVKTSTSTPTSGVEKPVIGESPTCGSKTEVPQKKLSFSPSVDVNTSTDGARDGKTDPKKKLKKGRRSEGQGSSKKDSSKLRRLSLRIEKTLNDQETDEKLLQPNQTKNSPEISQSGPAQKLTFSPVQKNHSDSIKHSADELKTQTREGACGTNSHSGSKPQVNQRRKRKLLSTNTDFIPNQILTEPTQSSKKDIQPKEARLSGKSCRNLSDRFEKVQDVSRQDSNGGVEGLGKAKKSSDGCGRSDKKSPSGEKNVRKRKKEVLSSDSSEEETPKTAKKRKEDSETTLPSLSATQQNGISTPSNRKSLDEFAPNKRLKQLKTKQQKVPKKRAASLSALNPNSEEKPKDNIAKSVGKRSLQSQSLIGESNARGGTSYESSSKAKPKKSRTNSGVVDDDSDSSLSSSEISKTSRQEKVIKVAKSSKKQKSGKPSLVTTSVHTGDQDLVASVVKKLKRFTVEDIVSQTTTHVICGENRRTLNLLRGVARGCWLLSIEWVLKSLEADKWLPEEPYEIQDDFPAAKIVRLERCRSGGAYQQDLLSSLGAVYVSEEATSPPKTDLLELITLCGGATCSSMNQASLCISGGRNQTGPPTVSEKWLLDCITVHQILPFDTYLL